ncbi:MAG TPA: Holliday junction branch migration protein RuvA [Polyangia bacterium]
MIAHVRGTLVDRDLEAVVVDVAGVGYAVSITAEAYRGLPPVGAEVRLFTYMHAVQDSAPQLFGFIDPDERRLFQALLAVQGVGPKVAIAILSGLPAEELVRAIAGADVARLTQIRGVGRKIAERLAVELRDKIVALGVGGRTGGGPSAAPAPARPVVPPGRIGEVHGALVALGYKPVEFEALLAKLDPEGAVPDLIKQALAGLRRK